MDNVRGTLLPVFSSDFGTDLTFNSLFIGVGQGCALVASLSLMWLTARLPLGKVVQLALFSCGLACLSTVLVSSKIAILVFGGLLGGSLALAGSLSSLLADEAAPAALKPQAMALCHATYGFSSLLAPLVAAAFISRGASWRTPFLLLLPFCFIIAYYAKKSIPPSVKPSEAFQLLNLKLQFRQVVAVATIVLYVGGEVLIVMWLPTWFRHRGFSISESSFSAATFFLLMMLTRLGVALMRSSKILRLITILALIFPVAFFVGGRLTQLDWLIPLTGIMGPFFPLFVTEVSAEYAKKSRVILLWMLSSMQAFLAILNFSLGSAADQFGLSLAYWIPAVLLTFAALGLFYYRKLHPDL
jgi:MFS family permease